MQTIEIFDDEGNSTVLPAVDRSCRKCKGEGFYFTGTKAPEGMVGSRMVTCLDCSGTGKALEPNFEIMSEEQKELWRGYCRDINEAIKVINQRD